MPIQNRDDAVEAEGQIAAIFAATLEGRTNAIRRLFVESLDFDPLSGQVSLNGAPINAVLPEAAERVAVLGGFHVLYIPLNIQGIDRVRKAEVDAAARLIADQLGDDMLLVFTNTSASQLHLILPKFEGSRPALRRMVVERYLHRRTAVQQVASIFWNHRDKGIIRAALDAAFDVEPVTKEFFGEYKRIFEETMGAVAGFDVGEDEDKRVFVQTLFNRLMFVYFLSRKGWLRFDGNAEYLNSLWRDYRSRESENNFYVSKLKPLFFAGLNNPQSRNLMKDNPVLYGVIGDVPFLNGGLFEETELDRRNGIMVPDAAIKQVLEGLFDRFNFTVMESTPFDIEVAVDPEMLGKVFEELVTGRHDSGAYYTPRTVVSFMCREALKGYLGGQDTGLAPGAIARFVDSQDTEGIGVAQARDVARALAVVTVVDPACGSGAYLLGMMQELVELQTALFSVTSDSASLYKLKLEIIQRNLYGADIDSFAVNIAMLRMWLSLAIDYEGATPEPLPNLDFKVVCGDSLLGLDPSSGAEVQVALGQDMEQVRRLGNLKGEYLRASSRADKDRLRTEIEVLNAAIRNALNLADTEGVVNWRVEFSEVFDARRGFDIAIANPPYVRFQKISRDYKKELKPIYGAATVGQSDLYCYFYARALQLLSEGGIHIFVCSNSWLDVGYGAKLQEYLLNNSHILSIHESAVERQFSTADINTIISLIRKSTPGLGSSTRFVSLRDDFESALDNSELRLEITRTGAELVNGGTREGKFVGEKWGGKFLRAPTIYHHLLEKYAYRFVRLGDIATVARGVITGANQFFFLKTSDISRWEIEEYFLAPVMTTPMESSSILVEVEDLPCKVFICHEPKTRLGGTRALDYIRWGESQGFHRKSAPASRRIWYNLGDRRTTQTAINIFVGSTAKTVLTCRPLLFSDNFQSIHLNGLVPSALCASMNSTLCQLVVNVEGRTNFGQGVLEIQTYEVSNLKIVDPRLLPEIDTAIFASSEWDVLNPSVQRRHIDEAIYDVLGLTVGERDAVFEGLLELVSNRQRRAVSV